jgi:hypothetical protein
MQGNEFEYLIADNYNPDMDIPDGFVTKVIPKFTWAVFSCKGAMPQAMQDVNKKIYSEWLPNCKDYEIAADTVSRCMKILLSTNMECRTRIIIVNCGFLQRKSKHQSSSPAPKGNEEFLLSANIQTHSRLELY